MDTPLYHLIVKLDCHVSIEREFVVPASIRLDDFHDVLQVVMGWHNEHTHKFETKSGSFVKTHSDGTIPRGAKDEETVSLANVVNEENKCLRYIYDFGDFWQHEIAVQSFDYKESVPHNIHCLSALGASPPEDIGGASGYAYFCEALNDPTHPDYKEQREQWGFKDGEVPPWPNEVSIEKINTRLHRCNLEKRKEMRDAAAFDDALTEIKQFDYIPTEAIRIIRKNKKKAIPVLLARIERVATLCGQIDEGDDAHLFAMFLLAEFRERKAFPYLVKFIEYDEDTLAIILGDIFTEDFVPILASTGGAEGIPSLQDLARRQDLAVINRAVALDALEALYVENAYPRADFLAYLDSLLDGAFSEPPSDCYTDEESFRGFVVSTICDIQGVELYNKVKAIYDADRIEDSIIDWDYFKSKLTSLAGPEGDFLREKLLLENSMYRFVSHIEPLASRWMPATRPSDDLQKNKQSSNESRRNSQKEAPKIGRNEPCPCGSGKKYKKCCANSNN